LSDTKCNYRKTTATISGIYLAAVWREEPQLGAVDLEVIPILSDIEQIFNKIPVL
jgi:hypothetical protein